MNRNIKLGIVISVLLLLGVVVFVVYSQKNYEESFVKEINRNLSAEDRKLYEDQITEADQKLDEVSSDQEKFKILVQKGYSLYGIGNLTGSRDVFKEALKLDSSDPSVHMALFQTLVDMGDNEGAKKSIDTVLKLKSSDPEIWRKYLQFQSEKLSLPNDRISSLYSEALIKTDNHIDMVTAYATWLESTGNYQASKEYWQKAIEINPVNKGMYDQEVYKLEQLLKTENS